MQLPKEVTTVTWVSKTLAFIAAVTLPFIGFFAGIRYVDYVSKSDYIAEETTTSIALNPPIISKIPEVKTYTNNGLHFKIDYPSDLSASQMPGIQGWKFSDQWGLTYWYPGDNFNNQTYDLTYFPYSGNLQSLLVVRKQIPNNNTYIYEDHPVIPNVFGSTVPSTIVKTLQIDNYTANWYDNNEVHFIAKGYGFIFRSVKNEVNEQEMINMLSSFSFTE